jgi:NADH-quinone oxidoreductase subunit J
LVKLAFIILAVIGVAAALMVITLKNVVHCAFSLVVTLFCVGCIFILLHAEFLAATQVLIYVGAIMILIIFALMLIDIKEANRQRQFHRQAGWVIAAGGVLTLEIILFVIPKSVFLVKPEEMIAQAAEAGGNTQLLGRFLFTDFLFAFEFASFIILVAIIAAIFLGRRSSPVSKESS